MYRRDGPNERNPWNALDRVDDDCILTTTHSEALDRLHHDRTHTTTHSEALDRLDHDSTHTTTLSEALDRLDRPGSTLRSSLALRCLRPPGRIDRGLALRFHQDRDRASVLPSRLPHPRLRSGSVVPRAQRFDGRSRGLAAVDARTPRRPVNLLVD